MLNLFLIQFENDSEWARCIFLITIISFIVIALAIIIISDFRNIRKLVKSAKNMTVKERGIYLYKELRKVLAKDDEEFEEIEEEAERLASEDEIEQRYYDPEEGIEDGRPTFIQKTIRSNEEFMTFCMNSIKREGTIYLLDNTNNMIVKVRDIIALDDEPALILLEDGSLLPYEDYRYSKA